MSASNVSFFDLTRLKCFENFHVYAFKQRVRSDFKSDCDWIEKYIWMQLNSSLQTSAMKLDIHDNIVIRFGDLALNVISADIKEVIAKETSDIQALFPNLHRSVNKIFGDYVDHVLSTERFDGIRSLYGRLHTFCLNFFKVFGSDNKFSNQSLVNRLLSEDCNVLVYESELDVLIKLSKLKCYDVMGTLLEAKLDDRYSGIDIVESCDIESILGADIVGSYEYQNYVFNNHVDTDKRINDYYTVFNHEADWYDNNKLRGVILEDMNKLSGFNNALYQSIVHDVFNDTDDIGGFLENLSINEVKAIYENIIKMLVPYRNVGILDNYYVKI